MAVRFLPPPEERSSGGSVDRSDLAEVIELRSKLGGRGWGGGVPSAVESEFAEPESEFEPDLEFAPELEPELASPALGENEPDRVSAYEDGVRLLARRARSSGELREELQRLEHPAYEIDAVIDEFERSHYLDDAGLARAVTEKLRDTKRASRAQIRIKLRERRLPDAVIEEAVGELDADEEFALLREAAADRARKLGGLDRQTAERRLLGFLARRGWSGEPAMRAAREALDGGSGRGSGVRFS